MTILSDTSPEAQRVLIDIYRRMTPDRKWKIIGEMYADARVLHAAGVRARDPQATNRDIVTSWIRDNLGFTNLSSRQEPDMTTAFVDALRELRAVLHCFKQVGLRYVLGGSMASSIHGISRHTRDADVTVEGLAGKEDQLIAALGPDYYLSVEAIRDALRRRSTFNIIHSLNGFKVDVFISAEQPFERSALSRRIAVATEDEPNEPLILYSPEDLILFKLRWYRLGNEISEQQWKDILGVFRVQGDRLDQAYLDHWAVDLGVADLLQRVRQECAA